MDEVELRLHLPEGDQSQDRLSVLVGPKVRVGPELVGRLEKAARKVLKID
jgi:hypothetical protein